MAQIQQNTDGSYSKSYSDVEIAIIREMASMKDQFANNDSDLWLAVGTIENRVDALEQAQVNLTELESVINTHSLKLSDHDKRLNTLEGTIALDPYSKEEIHKIMVPWKVEQIQHTFMTPTNQMFDESDVRSIRSGYVHYPNADIREPNGFQFPPNTMKRYSIWAYCDDPTVTQFRIRYADRCVVYHDEVAVGTYTGATGNFDGTAKVLTIHLNRGWNKLQFLVANQTQEGGLEIHSDLADRANALSSLDYLSGRFNGDQLEEGSLNGKHFSDNMDISIRRLSANITTEPALIAGSPTVGGSVQIGDALIEKAKDEPFIMNGDVRITGQLLVENLEIDASIIRMVSLSSELSIEAEKNSFYFAIDLSEYVQRSTFRTLQDRHDTLAQTLEAVQSDYSTLKASHQSLQQAHNNAIVDLNALKNRILALESKMESIEMKENDKN